MTVRLLFSFGVRLFTLVFFCCSPVMSADKEPVKVAALDVLLKQNFLIEQLAAQRSFTEIRLHQAASPLIQAIGVWSNGKAIFPDPEDTPHIIDAVVEHNKIRFEYLMNLEKQPAVESYDIHVDRILYCNKQIFSVCFIVGTDALAYEINISKIELVESLIDNNRNEYFKYDFGMLLGFFLFVFFVYLIILMLKKAKSNRSKFGLVEKDSCISEVKSSASHIIHMGDMEIDPKRMSIKRGQYEASISQRDLKLLVCLANNPDVVIAKYND